MYVRSPFSAALFFIVAIAVLFEAPGAAQYGRTANDRTSAAEWENSRFHVSRISVAAGANAQAAGDRVLVYLTADQDGRMPAAEAAWQPAGSAAFENRGRTRLDAISIELKTAPAADAAPTPPEALSASDRAEVWTLIDNDRVLVTKHRYAPATYVDPVHFHPLGALIVYLRGGYTYPAVFDWRGSYRVQRGDFDVIPANTLHTLSNAGSDPLEFLMVMPK